MRCCCDKPSFLRSYPIIRIRRSAHRIVGVTKAGSIYTYTYISHPVRAVRPHDDVEQLRQRVHVDVVAALCEMQRYVIAHAHEDAFLEEGYSKPNPFRQPLKKKSRCV